MTNEATIEATLDEAASIDLEEVKALRRVISNLQPFSPRARARILRYVLDQAGERQAELTFPTTTPATEG